MDSLSLERLSAVIEDLKQQVHNCGSTEELGKRVEDLSKTGITINELFNDIKSMIPAEEAEKLGIDSGLTEINDLIAKTKIEFDSLAALQDEIFKKG